MLAALTAAALIAPGCGGGSSTLPAADRPPPPAKVPNAGLQGKAIGPFPAREESISTEPRFESNTTADDPHSLTTVYVTNVNLPSNGQWRAGALIEEAGKLTATTIPPVNVD